MSNVFRSRLAVTALLAWLGIGAPAGAGNPAAPGTEVLWLLEDCSAAGHTLGTDCFQDVAALQDKIWGGSGLHPTATTPLVVDIGPGEFTGTLICEDGGYVTFRGMGRDRSRLRASDTPLGFNGSVSTPLSVTNCTALAFQDLTLSAPQTAVLGGYGVAWTGGGSSSWTDVDIDSVGAPWYDTGCGAPYTDPPPGEHYFWGSKLVAHRALGYFAQCGVSWLYGSEIRVQQDYAVSGAVRGVVVQGRGEVQMFGSTVRVFVGALSSSSNNLVGVNVGIGSQGSGFGEFHSHGGAIAVDASKAVNATGINVNKDTSGDAKAHTFETAFVVVKGSGTATRLAGNGNHESPFLWQQGTDVPVAGLLSKTGADMFVETDCSPTGCSSGTDPHLMIYSESCSGGWFDLVRQTCR